MRNYFRLILSISLICISISCTRKDSPPAQKPALPDVEIDGGGIFRQDFEIFYTVHSEGSSPVTASGMCWGTNIDKLDHKTMDGMGLGSFKSFIPLDSLPKGAKYYVKAYATNGVGTALSSTYLER